MITKEFLQKHFNHHDKLVVYQGDIPLTITKQWHLHMNGGHHSFDIYDCQDLAELCSKKHLSLKAISMNDGSEGQEHTGIFSI